ncbi:hypothetical protein IJS77_01930 [bacterium]|nr:hypothetical protein [bacterium]
MNISKINSTPAFKGSIMVPIKTQHNQPVYKVFDTKAISFIRKYNNGTQIRYLNEDYFVNKEKASFQDIAAAYNMSRDNLFDVDLTTSLETYLTV